MLLEEKSTGGNLDLQTNFNCMNQDCGLIVNPIWSNQMLQWINWDLSHFHLFLYLHLYSFLLFSHPVLSFFPPGPQPCLSTSYFSSIYQLLSFHFLPIYTSYYHFISCLYITAIYYHFISCLYMYQLLSFHILLQLMLMSHH